MSRLDARGKWRPGRPWTSRAFFRVNAHGALTLHTRCECGATCSTYPSLVLFIECKRCGSEVPIHWSQGIA